MFLYILVKIFDMILNVIISIFIFCFLMFKKYILWEKNKKILVDGL